MVTSTCTGSSGCSTTTTTSTTTEPPLSHHPSDQSSSTPLGVLKFEISPNLGAIARVGRPERPERPRQRPQRVPRHRSHPGHPRTTGDYARLLDIAKREGAQGFRSYGGADYCTALSNNTPRSSLRAGLLYPVRVGQPVPVDFILIDYRVSRLHE